MIILAENRKKTKGMPSSTGSYKTKEMGALARLPFHQLYSFFTVPDSDYFPTDDCHIEQGHHDKEQEAQDDGGQKT